RERIAVKQAILAREMGLSPSVLSDYESGRRASPGVGFIKRYVNALVKLDQTHHKLLVKEVEPKDRSAILSIGEFSEPVKAGRLVELLSGMVVTGAEKLDTEIYGYTVLDSIKTIYALSGFDFYKIYGATTERLLVFTKVGLGRSPMVAIRVVHLKPRMVVLHGPKEIDQVGKALAEKERIILSLSGMKEEELIQKLSEMASPKTVHPPLQFGEPKDKR
ncbi:MAG TPA: helix-turn-helix domain-containing protein, partial [Nitrososphaerales archaeon]|nr:helix-turn-helix domain-containing protein [Nitrososphaerales archaeon]